MGISKREEEVLQLISHGLSTHEIANELYISFYTVATHRRSLLAKMDAPNVASLIRLAFEKGLLHVTT